MIETGAAAGAAAGAAKAVGATKAAAFGTSAAVGIAGGLLMVLLDPPATRRQMFIQAVAAGMVSIICGPAAVEAADHYLDFINLAGADFGTVLEIAAPVYFLLGTVGWGVTSFLLRMRSIIGSRGADALADKVLGDKKDEQP